MAVDETTVGATDEARLVARPSARPRLLLLFGPRPDALGQQRPLTQAVSIGREPTGDGGWAIGDPRMSRHHATIKPGPSAGLFEVIDHDSRNGTFVGGRRIEKQIVEAGSILRLGDSLFEVGVHAERPDDLPDDVIGGAASFLDVVEKIRRAAELGTSLHVFGETGTGKEVVSRLYHRFSGRPGECVAVNCGAFPDTLVEAHLFGHVKGAFTGATADVPGAFERSKGGTLFLDEVGELPRDHQPKLLRVLDSGVYTAVGDTKERVSDAAIVSATNADLTARVAAGLFRADLFARLSQVLVTLPPLRRRRSDIPALMWACFRRKLGTDLPKVTAGFVEELLLRSWPMNIRELNNTLLQAIVQHDGHGPLERGHLPPEAPPPAPAPTPASRPAGGRPSREAVEEALREAAGNVSKAALALETSPRQVYRWLKLFDLDPDAFRS